MSDLDVYTHIAHKAVFIWKAYLEEALSINAPLIRYLGGFDGLGGHIYVLTHLGVLWQDNSLIALGKSLVEKWKPFIERDKHLNILSGAAGYLVSLLNLYDVCPQQNIMEAAVACGDHIRRQVDIENPSDSMQKLNIGVGFAQGGAGIAWALLKLAYYTGQESFRQISKMFLDYERQKLKGVDNQQATWCTGMTGVGMARLCSLKYTNDPKMLPEIKQAVNVTLDQSFNRNHSLCHGELGVIDFLHQANHILQDGAINQQVNQRSSQILSTIKLNGPLSGLPHRVDAVGLMHGLAGIGYGLLRLANPEQVPSILSLEPPRESAL